MIVVILYVIMVAFVFPVIFNFVFCNTNTSVIF